MASYIVLFSYHNTNNVVFEVSYIHCSITNLTCKGSQKSVVFIRQNHNTNPAATAYLFI